MGIALKENIEQLLLSALQEDRAIQDITSLACFPENRSIHASIVAKEHLCLAGMPFVPFSFKQLDPCIEVVAHFSDGTHCPSGSVLATIKGSATSVLAAERTVLNLLQHMCGIATLTSRYVKEIEGFSCDILDTRKTLPSLRSLQKYAVRQGGGKNHRFSLQEAILIKNNHLHILKAQSSHPVREAIQLTRQNHQGKKIEIEVEDLQQMDEALAENADVILLDNMSLPMMQEAVRMNQNKAYLEASGGIDLTKVKKIAETGVNGISIGALTHSVKAVDISLRARPC
jgi:nicotinate-nucleotide pyrophosphorylase (carboxylating)